MSPEIKKHIPFTDDQFTELKTGDKALLVINEGEYGVIAEVYVEDAGSENDITVIIENIVKRGSRSSHHPNMGLRAKKQQIFFLPSDREIS